MYVENCLILRLLVSYMKFDLISEPILIMCDAAPNSGVFMNGILTIARKVCIGNKKKQLHS